MDWLVDDRTDCYSVQTKMKVSQYLSLVEDAHASRGGLSGQRDTLKTTTAKRIRSRMVSDIRRGAILPPVVIGAVVPDDLFSSYPISQAKLKDILPPEEDRELAIIDGMQRTSALREAVSIDSSVLERQIRVEFWLTKDVRTMVYRMLVLNTGQVPWTLGRQLAVVYAPMLDELKAEVPGLSRIFVPDSPGRRVTAGEFSGEALVELYIAFSLRKTNIDTKEALSDEFSRLDFVDNLSQTAFQEQFYSTIGILVNIDAAFSRYDVGQSGRLSKGRNIFDSQPARIGFIVAAAQYILGRPGMDRDEGAREQRRASIDRRSKSFVKRLDAMSIKDLGRFLKLDVLRETLDKRVGQVGRYERSIFNDAFLVLITDNFDLPDMEPCWRAN